jgi:2-keto-3-deoxy-6-phosphogluconate aldolase
MNGADMGPLRAAFMPRGGVNIGNLVKWFIAGAVGVDAGGELCEAASMLSARWEEITAITVDFAAAPRHIQAVRL